MRGKAFAHWLKHLLHFEDAVTQTSINEQELLKKYIANVNQIAEIGVFEGYNTREFALHSKQEVVIYAIDPFFKGMFGFSYGKSIAKKEWKRSKVSYKIRITKGLSWDVIDKIPASIDFIFVDGDHSFEGVKRDFNLYADKLSANGVMAFHDSRIFVNGWTRPDWGPVRLVEEIIKPSNEWEIIDQVDSLVVIRRKPVKF